MDATEIQPIAELTDPGQRARRASDLIEEHQSAITELSRTRREALDEMLSQGMSQTQIAELLDMTRSRVGQLLSSGPKPERALLGSGTITIAVGGKYEADKPEPGHVVSTESFAAYEGLATLARGHGFKTEYEVVPPPGMVELNRTNLIVVGSPRILPFVGQVLASDTKLGFANDGNGWYLVDDHSGQTYRSPADNGESVDYAYVGRLPRPDGRGTFLYLAGIHAMGSLGAGKFLQDNIEDLYREVKTRRFSLLVSCEYDPKTREIAKVERLTPLYRAEGIG